MSAALEIRMVENAPFGIISGLDGRKLEASRPATDAEDCTISPALRVRGLASDRRSHAVAGRDLPDQALDQHAGILPRRLDRKVGVPDERKRPRHFLSRV